MPSVTFDKWVDAVFNHPVRKPEWFWDQEFHHLWDSLGLFDALAIEYMTRLFQAPNCLERYSLDQIAQGIWFLIGDSSPGQSVNALLKSNVPLRQRIDCVNAMANFFRVFVAQAAPDAANEQEDSFHVACYMWWDIFPTYGSPKAGETQLHGACLNTMAAILTIPSELCQLSALHGLNHWHLHHAARVEALVDQFLEKTPRLTPRIIKYAALARSGCAL